MKAVKAWAIVDDRTHRLRWVSTAKIGGKAHRDIIETQGAYLVRVEIREIKPKRNKQSAPDCDLYGPNNPNKLIRVGGFEKGNPMYDQTFPKPKRKVKR